MKTATRRQLIPGLAFILPNFLGFVTFTAGPVLFSLAAAFTNWNVVGSVPLEWVGLDNFIELWGDPNFWRSLVTTFYLMMGIPVAIAGSLALAVLLNGRIKGVVFFRTLYYLPTFTAGIALMILWKALYNPEFGPINHLLDAAAAGLGWESFEPPAWLQSTNNLLALTAERVGFDAAFFGLGARDALVFMGIWIAIGGNNMLLYIAALQNVPVELSEAARIDGAGRWATFRHVTWPQLMPTTFFIVVMSIIGGLQGGFEMAQVMTLGGPAGTTRPLAYYIYEEAFVEFQIGYASAAAWALFILIFGMTLVYWKFGNRSTDG